MCTVSFYPAVCLFVDRHSILLLPQNTGVTTIRVYKVVLGAVIAIKTIGMKYSTHHQLRWAAATYDLYNQDNVKTNCAYELIMNGAESQLENNVPALASLN